jgi:hypothetical protein
MSSEAPTLVKTPSIKPATLIVELKSISVIGSITTLIFI